MKKSGLFINSKNVTKTKSMSTDIKKYPKGSLLNELPPSNYQMGN